MTRSQLEAYDRFLDENDWDIYYWVTQKPEDAPKPGSGTNTKDTVTDTWKSGAAKSGEWAQTVGAFKPAYRPVPERWAGSEILALLKQHVQEKSAGGRAHGAQGGDGEASSSASGGGLGRMPDVLVFDA
jgi:hypothetical protein